MQKSQSAKSTPSRAAAKTTNSGKRYAKPRMKKGPRLSNVVAQVLLSAKGT